MVGKETLHYRHDGTTDDGGTDDAGSRSGKFAVNSNNK